MTVRRVAVVSVLSASCTRWFTAAGDVPVYLADLITRVGIGRAASEEMEDSRRLLLMQASCLLADSWGNQVDGVAAQTVSVAFAVLLCVIRLRVMLNITVQQLCIIVISFCSAYLWPIPRGTSPPVTWCTHEIMYRSCNNKSLLSPSDINMSFQQPFPFPSPLPLLRGKEGGEGERERG